MTKSRSVITFLDLLILFEVLLHLHCTVTRACITDSAFWDKFWWLPLLINNRYNITFDSFNVFEQQANLCDLLFRWSFGFRVIWTINTEAFCPVNPFVCVSQKVMNLICIIKGIQSLSWSVSVPTRWSQSSCLYEINFSQDQCYFVIVVTSSYWGCQRLILIFCFKNALYI